MTKARTEYHHDEVRFGDALSFTALETGFSARLIEKDYYCSLILRELKPLFDVGLVFKGGTALAKVHAEFYRLSEDLDFSVSIDWGARRADRRAAARPIKEFLETLPRLLDCLKTVRIRGQNESRHYDGAFTYLSRISGQEETIKAEVSFREPVLEPCESRDANTLLINPLRGEPAVIAIQVKVLGLPETYAEKARAALSRREPAIRDFYDLDFARQKGIVDLFEPASVSLLRSKLGIVGADPIDLSESRLNALRRQIATELQPVLRPGDFAAFDLDRTFAEMQRLADKLLETA